MINDHAFVSAYFQIIQLNTFDDGSWWANEDMRNDDFFIYVPCHILQTTAQAACDLLYDPFF